MSHALRRQLRECAKNQPYLIPTAFYPATRFRLPAQPMHKKIGGIHFFRIGKIRFQFSIAA